MVRVLFRLFPLRIIASTMVDVAGGFPNAPTNFNIAFPARAMFVLCYGRYPRTEKEEVGFVCANDGGKKNPGVGAPNEHAFL